MTCVWENDLCYMTFIVLVFYSVLGCFVKCLHDALLRHFHSATAYTFYFKTGLS